MPKNLYLGGGAHKGKKGRFKRVISWFTVGLLILVLGAAIGVTVIITSGQARYGKLDTALLTQQPLTTLILDREENIVASLHGGQNRIYTPIEEIPQRVRQAFFAAEDLRFPNHNGVDVLRIVGAALHDVRTGSLSQGASTITQQLIKITHLSEEKSFTRKIYEAWLALQLESMYSKDQILEMYLNTVYFGAGAYGIESASQVYFGKSVGDISLAESALLAGILKSPTRYAPHRNPEESIRRRNLILTTMEEAGFATPAEIAAAKDEALLLAEPSDPYPYGWYIDTVTEEASRILGIDVDTLNAGGYRIYTALDTGWQEAAERLAADPENLPPAAEDGVMPQVALVAVIPGTGEIPALVGGSEHTTRRAHNRATDMRRQPGSTLKPLAVYTPAIENLGYHPTTFVEDVPTTFGGWTPNNFNDRYLGTITLRNAIARSQNIPAVKTLEAVGVPAARSSLERYGLKLDAQDAYLPLGLGSLTYGATPLEMAAGYAAIAAEGIYQKPHTVVRIEDRSGLVVHQANQPGERAADAETAYLLTDMMRSTAIWGTAKSVGALGYPAAAKTGTIGQSEGGNRDIWTCAYTPSLSVAVWMGYDEPSQIHAIPNSMTGGTLPAALAASFIGAAQPQGGGDFAVPTTLHHVAIDSYTLEQELRVVRATDLTPLEYRGDEWFRVGQEPTEVSSYWVRPSAPLSFTVTQGDQGLPLIQVVIAQDFARYRVYRQSGYATPVEIGVIEGSVGEIKTLLDASATRTESFRYTVIPEHKIAQDAGLDSRGRVTLPVAYTVPPTNRPGVIDDLDNLPDLDDFLGLPDLSETPAQEASPSPSPIPDAATPYPSPTPGTPRPFGNLLLPPTLSP